MPSVPCMAVWSMCPHANEPNMCQILIITCQRGNKCAKGVPIIQLGMPTCQGMPIFQLHLPKGVLIFQLFFKRIFQFLNFSIMLTICKFQDFDNSKKFIWWNKEFKLFWYLQNFIKEKPCQPKTFDVIFNKVWWINRTIIWLR